MGKVKPRFETQRQTFIREWRKDRGLTLERLAERIGVTAGALSQLERGETGYTQPMLEALADELHCEPADLIARSPGDLTSLHVVWDAIPDDMKPQALRVLGAFVKKESIAKIVVLAFCVLLIAHHPVAAQQIDMQCQSNCLDAGYQFHFCRSRCSYDVSPQPQQQPQYSPAPAPMVDMMCVTRCTDLGYNVNFCRSKCEY